LLVSDFITNVRYRINDTLKIEYTDDELINYINDALAVLSLELITLKDPLVIKTLSVASTGTNVPSDYHSLAGIYPLTITEGVLTPYDSVALTINYFKMLPSVTATTDSITLTNPAYYDMLLQRVAITALNRNEFVLTQDISLLQVDKQTFGGSKAK
jgi:hypothetical protein